MNSKDLAKSEFTVNVYVGTYALIYLHTILGEGMDPRDGLPRGALPSGILKTRKNVQALKFPARDND